MFSPYKEMEAARGRSPQPSAPEKRGPGRPRLPTPERRRNVLLSKRKWRLENHEYYLNQKRELASRPEYLTRRRELRAIKGTCVWQDVSAAACDTSPTLHSRVVAGVGPPCHKHLRCDPVPDDARKSILDYATLDNVGADHVVVPWTGSHIQIAYSSKMDAQPL